MMHSERHESLMSPRRPWVRPALLGLLLGVGFGLWNLISTQLDPLAEDTLTALLAFYGPMFAIWGFASFVAARRTGRPLDGIKTGAIVAFATFLAFDVAVILRVNLFLDELTRRLDWQNLLARFEASGFENLRVYANYEYVTGAPFKALVSTMIGTGTGVVGGFLGRLAHAGRNTSVA